MRDLKYSLAYIIPIISVIAIMFRGHFSFLTVVVIFGIVPVLEYILPQNTSNHSAEVSDSLVKKKVFDWLLYINIPIVYGTGIYFLYIVSSVKLELYELVGLIFCVSIVFASNGINVAHELGHRKENYHKWMSKFLLLPAMYSHFIIEHNLGHHKHVATDIDPASAKKNEPIYFFWLRSTIGTYKNAWAIEIKRMKKNQQNFFSLKNEMLIITILQLSTLLLVYLAFGAYVLLIFCITALVSALFLETINYIEHYGLRRDYKNGRYEKVTPMHSWNSNHEVGRILLYELTRHSDHHFLSNKKYQVLDNHEDARQLPLGYPGSMLVAMVPPVWFRLMNHRI